MLIVSHSLVRSMRKHNTSFPDVTVIETRESRVLFVDAMNGGDYVERDPNNDAEIAHPGCTEGVLVWRLSTGKSSRNVPLLSFLRRSPNHKLITSIYNLINSAPLWSTLLPHTVNPSRTTHLSDMPFNRCVLQLAWILSLAHGKAAGGLSYLG